MNEPLPAYAEPGWKILSREVHYQNPHVEVGLVQVTTPSRPDPRMWTVARRKQGVAIAPMTADGRLLLIRQERIPILQTIWEFPAGQIDVPDEPTPDAIRATAARELVEETGYRLAPGGEWIACGRFFCSQGFTNENVHLFVARFVEPDPEGQKLDAGEAIAPPEAFTRREIEQMVMDNIIRDGNSLSLIAHLGIRSLWPA